MKAHLLSLTMTFIVLLVPGLSVGAESDGFKELRKTKDGITVSRKAGPTKGFYITRFDATSPVAPAALCDSLWRSFFKHQAPVAERKFIRKEADELVFHDKVKTPVVSDRDYIMKITRKASSDGCVIDFHTANEMGPPPDEGYVRMPLVEGHWKVSGAADGTSVVRYQVYSEPGGSVPALIIKEPQVKEALSDFRRSLKEALGAR